MHSGLVEEKLAALQGALASQIAKKESNKPEEVTINSRFGPVVVQPEKAICFPHGIPGLPGVMNFCITDIPNIKTGQFKLLQCLGDASLSFIVVPSTYDNQLLETIDMDDACNILGINKNDLLLLFIVTSHETPAGRRLSINAKAPIFVDSLCQAAVQYVFQSNHYEIQHFIS